MIGKVVQKQRKGLPYPGSATPPCCMADVNTHHLLRDARMSMAEINTLPGKERTTGDRWCLWPSAAMVGAVAIIGIGFVIEPFMFMLYGPAGIMILAIVALSGVVAAVVLARRKMWRRAMSAAMLPMTFVTVTINSVTILRALSHVWDHARFWACSASYEAHISALPGDQGRRFAAFSWGGFMLNPVYLVYDESDEVGLPPDQRTKAWLARSGQLGEFSVCKDGAHRVRAHYYVVHFSC